VPIGEYYGIVQNVSEDPAGASERFWCLLCLKEQLEEVEAGKWHSLLNRYLDAAAAIKPPILERNEA
jgi:hypothetical protein